jgi:hypothetical protein
MKSNICRGLWEPYLISKKYILKQLRSAIVDIREYNKVVIGEYVMEPFS